MVIVYTFLLIMLVVSVHEYGHYIVMRAFGVRAKSFMVGFGPALFQVHDKSGTEWSVRAFPLGGAVVAVDGDLENLSPLRSFLVYAAGPGINILFAIILMIPVLGLWAAPVALYLVGKLIAILPMAVFDFVTFNNDALHGPVGMAKDAVAQKDMFSSFNAICAQAALMNLGLAAFNLLPIPPLDGGHMVFSLIEKFTGKTRIEKFRQYATVVGVVIILALVIMLLVRDVIR